MQAEIVDYSIGERSLSKLVKYHERESLLLEIDSIQDYIRILEQANNTVFDEEMQHKVFTLMRLEKEVENLCVEMNQTLSELLDQKQPAEEQLLRVKELIENIIYSQTCIDRDEKTTNILEKEPILKYMEEILTDVQDEEALLLDKPTQNEMDKRLAEYCAQDAPICDEENEGRIESEYTVYERNELTLIEREQQLMRDKIHFEEQKNAEATSSEADTELKKAEDEYTSLYVEVKSANAYNQCVEWASAQLSEIDVGIVEYERKFFPQQYMSVIKQHMPRACEFDHMLELQERIRAAAQQESKDAGQTEFDRFKDIERRFAALTTRMSTVFDQIKEGSTEGSEILNGSVEDIYRAVQGLEQCNQEVESAEKLQFCAAADTCTRVNELIRDYNAQIQDLERFQNDLRELLLVFREEVQRIHNSKSSLTPQPSDFASQADEVMARVESLTAELQRYRSFLFEQERVNARIFLLNKYIEQQMSPYTRRYMAESAAEQCEFCKQRIWSFVEVQTGKKYCLKCAQDKSAESGGLKFEDEFIEARFD